MRPGHAKDVAPRSRDGRRLEHVVDAERLATPSGVAAVLRQYGLAPRKGLGQNFLVDRNVLRQIVEAARLSKDDTVMEIGPGLGVLTWALADAARTVIAVELDDGLVRWLNDLLRARDNVHVVHGDALEVDFHRVLADHRPGPSGAYKVIANLPYYITTPLLMRLLEEKLPLDSIVVMVQREVAQRMTAAPGTKQYGALSVAVQLRSAPELVSVVSPRVFFPPPTVESAIVRLSLRPFPPDVQDETMLFAVVRAAFSQRRKTLRNTLRAAARAVDGPGAGLWSAADVDPALEAAGVDGGRRGETLSKDEFVRLANALTGPPTPPNVQRRLTSQR